MVHRQVAPDVAGRGQRLQTDVSDEHDRRVGRRGDRRERTARLGGQQVLEPAGALGQLGSSGEIELLDGPCPASLGEVATLGEQHDGVAGRRGARHPLDLRHHVAAGPTTHEARADPVEQHVDGGVELEQVLQHDPRPTRDTTVHHRIHDQERVAGAGVPAEHQHRSIGTRLGERVVLIVEGEAEREPGRRHQPAQEPRHQPVVAIERSLATDPPPEPGRQPQDEQHHQYGHLEHEVHEREPHEPEQSPPTGHEPRDEPGDHQPQREQSDRPHEQRERERHRDHPSRPLRQQQQTHQRSSASRRARYSAVASRAPSIRTRGSSRRRQANCRRSSIAN